VLKRAGYRYKKVARKKITQEVKNLRLKFCRTMLKNPSDIGFTIWTDETSFWLNRSKSNKQWVCTSNEDMEEEIVQNNASIMRNHGPKINVWGGISSIGTVTLDIFESNLTSEMYVDILSERLEEFESLYPDGYVWMHDNDPKHTANLTKNFLNEHMDKVLEWPKYSPDLNPIENIWSWLKRKCNEDQPKTIDELRKCILKHWRAITPQFLAPYINGLEDRFRKVVKKQGGYINK
jgi:transposase